MIVLFGATSPLLFLSLLILLGCTPQLLIDICGRFLVGVSKLLHTGEELMFSLCEFWGNHGDTVAYGRLDKLLYSLNK